MLLDVNDGLVGARHDGLDRGAGKPVDDAAAHQKPQDNLRVDQAELGDDIPEEPFEQDDDSENHRGCPDDGRADEDRFGRGLEGVPRAVRGLEIELCLLKVHIDAEVFLDDLFGVLAALDHRELIDGLGIVGNRAKTVHGDRHRTHSQETERDETEGEDRRGKNERRGHEAQDRAAL